MSNIEALTAVLILVTGFYAWQNLRMVKEMRNARKVSIMPKLAIEWTMASPTIGLPTVKNVGPGPALDVDICIHYEPMPGQEEKTKVRRWTTNIMVQGERKEFLPIEGDHSGSMQTDELATTYESIRLTGSYTDALGDSHTAVGALLDIAEWRKISKEAIARWQNPDDIKRLSEEMAKRFKSEFEPILKKLDE